MSFFRFGSLVKFDMQVDDQLSLSTDPGQRENETKLSILKKKFKEFCSVKVIYK